MWLCRLCAVCTVHCTFSESLQTAVHVWLCGVARGGRRAGAPRTQCILNHTVAAQPGVARTPTPAPRAPCPWCARRRTPRPRHAHAARAINAARWSLQLRLARRATLSRVRGVGGCMWGANQIVQQGLRPHHDTSRACAVERGARALSHGRRSAQRGTRAATRRRVLSPLSHSVTKVCDLCAGQRKPHSRATKSGAGRDATSRGAFQHRSAYVT